MAYSTKTDVRALALQLPTGIDADAVLDAAIAAADGVIDAHLRGTYDVPLTTVDKIIETISARIAAGRSLQTYQAQVKTKTSEYADGLIAEAMNDLRKILGDPSMLSIEPRPIDGDDYEKNSVMVSDDDDSRFTTGREDTWDDD